MLLLCTSFCVTWTRLFQWWLASCISVLGKKLLLNISKCKIQHVLQSFFVSLKEKKMFMQAMYSYKPCRDWQNMRAVLILSVQTILKCFIKFCIQQRKQVFYFFYKTNLTFHQHANVHAQRLSGIIKHVKDSSSPMISDIYSQRT